MITRENYEEHFLDYFEGNLSDKEVEELLRFLSLNSDLEEEFYMLMQHSSEMEVIADDFSSLTLTREAKVEFELSTFDYLCIAELENDISSDEHKMLQGSLNVNSKLVHEHALFQQTKLVAEPVVYPYKSELKKNLFAVNTRKVVAYSSIAAAVLVVFYFTLYDNASTPMLAQVSDSITTVQSTSKNGSNTRDTVAKEPSSSSKIEADIDTRPVYVQTNKAKEAYRKKIAQVDTTTPTVQHEVVSTSQFDNIKEIAYVELNSNIKVIPSGSNLSTSLDESGNSVENYDFNTQSASSDAELARKVDGFINSSLAKPVEVANTLKDYSGRKKGVIIGRIVAGVNALFGTNIEYSSKYSADGKLMNVDFQAGYISYTKNYEVEE